MSPAARALEAGTDPARLPGRARLLVVDRETRVVSDALVGDLPALLAPGDLIVLNDAATLPASLRVGGGELELRLAEPPRGDRALAVLFGAGDHRTPTERRPPPPVLVPGARLVLGEDLEARVVRRLPPSPRLVEVAFDRDGPALLDALYRHGRPVQYAHVQAPLPLWAVQTPYAARPFAVEMPSTGRPLSLRLLSRARARGIGVATLTHAAGLSATGDPALDRALPLPERYAIPPRTVQAIRAARARGGRVLAVGTTVARALEGVVRDRGDLVAGDGVTSLRLGPGDAPRVVTGILTGIHSPGESHHELLRAFAPDGLLAAAHERARRGGYLAHELGDLMLVRAGA